MEKALPGSLSNTNPLQLIKVLSRTHFINTKFLLTVHHTAVYTLYTIYTALFFKKTT